MIKTRYIDQTGKKIILHLFLSVFLFLFFSCETEYNLEITDYKKEYVVDGQISDQRGPHRVKITYTAVYDDGREGLNLLVPGANVTITDADGITHVLTEYEPGIYQTSEYFSAVPGNAYVLHILAGFSDELFSFPETMPTGPDSVGYYYEFTGTQNVENPGHMVWVTIKDPPEYKNFYKWNWEGAYVFSTYFDGLPGSTTCWRYEYDKDLMQLATDRFFNGNQYRQFVCFIPYFSSGKYLVTLYQRSLSMEAYEFFGLVDKQLNESGGIFALPPATIRGNMYCVNDPSVDVLGYFAAVSYQKIPVLIKRDGLGPSKSLRSYPRNVYCGDLPNSEEFNYDPSTWPEGWE